MYTAFWSSTRFKGSDGPPCLPLQQDELRHCTHEHQRTSISNTSSEPSLWKIEIDHSPEKGGVLSSSRNTRASREVK
jgi:hypothetical protein